MKKTTNSGVPLWDIPKIDLKMKLTTILVIVSFFQIQASTYSQTTKISLDLTQVRVEKVLDEIERNTDFKFLADTQEVNLGRIVSIKVKNEKIKTILDRIFTDGNVVYSILGKQIVLKRNTQILTDGNNPVVQRSVSGTAVDADGQPLPGVNVIEKGTGNGTSTDFDGNYTLNVSSDSATLVFSYIGFVTVEVPIADQTTINVTMKEDASQLDEVVVTALGIRKDAKALGYAVSKVSSERVLASGSPVNALQSLYGTASGVQVAGTASGPTGGFKINIRNAVSFDQNSTTRPLIVVDGIPIYDEDTGITANARTGRDNGTGINDINSEDIESMEILKGAKASVLYGSEGANGVILITTKSGSRSRGLGISASMTTTIEQSAFTPVLQDQYGTGRSASNAANDDQGFYINEAGERALDVAGPGFGPKYDPSVQLRWWDGSLRPWQPTNKDVFDQLFRTGSQRLLNVAVSSGGEKGSVRFAYTNMDYKPITRGGDYDRNTFSVNASYKLNDAISLKYVGNYFVTDNLNPSFEGSADAQGSTASLGGYTRDVDVDLLRSFLVTENGFNYFRGEDQQRNFISTGRSTVVRSLWDWTQNESEFRRLHGIQSLTLDVTLSKVFSAQVLAGIDNTDERRIYRGKLEDPSLIGPNSGSVFRDQNREIRRSYIQGTLNFDTSFNDWGISGLVGAIHRDNRFQTKGAERIGGFVIPNFFSFTNLPSGQQPNYINDNGRDVLYGVLGSVQVDWKDQVFIEAQARQDWSSILPPNNNSYFYPGLSTTWIASNSLNLPSFVKFLKLRTSWADVGRPGPLYFGNVNLGVSQSGNGFILSPPSSLPPIDAQFVQNLKPERKREFEAGLEAFLFENQRIGIDFSIYRANTYDQIMAITAPPGLGVNTVRVNAADVQNTGWELGLKTKPILSKNFQWGLDMTFASAQTKVNGLTDDLTSQLLFARNGLNYVAEVGGEYGTIIQQQGFRNYINPSDDNDPNNGARIVDNGGARYAYNRSSNRKVGKLLPDVTGGAFNRFSYKNFTLVANIDYSFGATFVSEAETYMLAAGVLRESLPFRDAATGGQAYYINDEGARVAGTNPGTGATFNDGVVLEGVRSDGTPNTQVVSAEEYYGASYFSNGFFPEDRIFKSDYIALRNVSLDYRLPVIADKMGLSEAVISVFANNVAYLYKAAPNSIPEASNGTGWSAGAFSTTALPLQRSLGLSLRVKL
ncbi:SusC/RagA family TonB-linked outer membrane protein [Flagellimonas myxillae]|uniref:SusC/RagA family TonB-linked outer membrane protein n=1 Tax=Flagellimonas myxillae TaxID=2942214 RepID=UPI00201EA318|nr:SusC/RagA family TonB-linked outer membrane protein [Muricauda myxillae]MCL6268216.1 SusC/RagA family TonB-linked outer membrane protein [Muricauda myxillae]